MGWYMYENITNGSELKTPVTDKLKLPKDFLNEPPKSGVTSLLTKQTKNIVNTMKTEKMSEANEENLNADKDLANETGKTRTKEKIAAQNICP